MKLLKLTILFYLLLPLTTYAQSSNQGLENGFKTGDSELITPYLSDLTELIVNETEGLYNRNEVANKLNKFFKDYPPTEFEVVHRGNSPSGSSYIIGELNTNSDAFRVYILFSDDDGDKIIEIRLEKNE